MKKKIWPPNSLDQIDKNLWIQMSTSSGQPWLSVRLSAGSPHWKKSPNWGNHSRLSSHLWRRVCGSGENSRSNWSKSGPWPAYRQSACVNAVITKIDIYQARQTSRVPPFAFETSAPRPLALTYWNLVGNKNLQTIRAMVEMPSIHSSVSRLSYPNRNHSIIWTLTLKSEWLPSRTSLHSSKLARVNSSTQGCRMSRRKHRRSSRIHLRVRKRHLRSVPRNNWLWSKHLTL